MDKKHLLIWSICFSIAAMPLYLRGSYAAPGKPY
jgi:hypothetical protein